MNTKQHIENVFLQQPYYDPTCTATKTPCQRYSVARVWEEPTAGSLSSLTAKKGGSPAREHQADVGLSSKLWYTPITGRWPSEVKIKNPHF